MADYVLFIDECGNHDLKNVDQNFPVFCLCGCLFERMYYREEVIPQMNAIKIKYWNRNDVIFHSRDIRKHEKEFHILADIGIREDFYLDLNATLSSLNFSIISIIIDINEHIKQYRDKAFHPYDLSLKYILERYSKCLDKKSSTGYALAESRGAVEDKKLIGLYKRYFNFGTDYVPPIKNVTSLTTKKKTENINGLQIADLIAYPIARKVIDPEKTNLAFEIIKSKIQSKNNGEESHFLGFGMKIFPFPARCKNLK